MKIFLSYAHHDEAACRELRRHLAPLEQVFPETTTWHDGKILAGERWAPEIAAQLDAADVILLLISAAFFESKFCWEKEMPRALARHKSGAAKALLRRALAIREKWLGPNHPHTQNSRRNT